MDRLKVYMAGGWFSKGEMKQLEDLEKIVESKGFSLYKPRVDGVKFENNLEVAYKIKQENKRAIFEADLIIFSLFFDKEKNRLDSGTIRELGFAEGINKKCVIFFNTPKENPVNLMLGTGSTYFDDLNNFSNYLNIVKGTNDKLNLINNKQYNYE